MNEMTPKNYSPAKTKAIFKAARNQFLLQGFKGATMDAIALEAGVSKQTLYNRYPDKQMLFQAILQEMISSISRETEKEPPIITTSADLRAALQSIGQEMVHTIANPEYLQFMRVILPEFHQYPELKEHFRTKMPDRIIGTLTLIFNTARDRGLIRTANPELLARMFAGTILTYILQRGVLGKPDEAMLTDAGVATLVEELLDMAGQAG